MSKKEQKIQKQHSKQIARYIIELSITSGKIIDDHLTTKRSTQHITLTYNNWANYPDHKNIPWLPRFGPSIALVIKSCLPSRRHILMKLLQVVTKTTNPDLYILDVLVYYIP